MDVTAATEPIIDPATSRPHPLRTARLAFRDWRRSRPFWAGVWAILGGALIAYVPATAFKLFLVANASLVIGVLVGALVGFFGLMLWFARPLRVLLGVLILLLSLVSFLTSDFGGLLLGMLMGLIGGSLALAWVPSKVTWRERRRARKLAAAGVTVTAPAVAAPAAAAPALAAGSSDGPTEQAADEPEPMPPGLAAMLSDSADTAEPAGTETGDGQPQPRHAAPSGPAG